MIIKLRINKNVYDHKRNQRKDRVRLQQWEN